MNYIYCISLDKTIKLFEINFLNFYFIFFFSLFPVASFFEKIFISDFEINDCLLILYISFAYIQNDRIKQPTGGFGNEKKLMFDVCEIDTT